MHTSYFTISKNTARRVWQRRSFWIINGLLAFLPLLFSILAFLGDPTRSPINGSGVQGIGTLPLYYLVLPLIVGPVILEDFGKVAEILWSTSLDNLVFFAGLFTGVFVALLSGSLIQLGGWFLSDLLWTNILPQWSWLVTLAIYFLANLLGLSLTFLLAVLTRRYLPMMLSWAALWVWIYFIGFFVVSLMERFQALSATAFTNIFFNNLTLSPSLGLGLVQDQLLGMFAWFIGLSLVALALALILAPLLDPRRASRLTWFPPLFTAVALLAALAGFVLNSRAQTLHDISPSPLSVQIDVWEVLNQRTQVDLDASRGTISGTARLQLAAVQPSNHSEIVLRLNPGLQLTGATDENGQDLLFQRVGDSLIISREVLPDTPVTLNLAWNGKLHIPYTAYEQRWLHATAPYPHHFDKMPTALNAFIQPVAGYLLRDGDWMPWPWTSLPHQAGQSHLTIRPQGGEAAASVPIHDGQTVWEGQLPSGLLVFLPQKQVQAAGMTVAVSSYVGRQHEQQAALFAASANRLASLFNVPPPRYVVVAPYLSDLVWSGDLLLLPDGSGYYLAESLRWLYQHDITGSQQPVLARATLASLARAYLLNQIPPSPREYQALVTPQRGEKNTVNIAGLSEQAWQADNGYWMQAVESFDVITTWNPRRVLELSPQGKWSALAFWFATEIADESTRQADLDLLAYFAGEGKPERYFTSSDYRLVARRAWPSILETEPARALVLAMHQWTEALGSQEALSLFSAVIHDTRPATVEELIAELEQRSGHTVIEEQP